MIKFSRTPSSWMHGRIMIILGKLLIMVLWIYEYSILFHTFNLIFHYDLSKPGVHTCQKKNHKTKPESKCYNDKSTKIPKTVSYIYLEHISSNLQVLPVYFEYGLIYFLTRPSSSMWYKILNLDFGISPTWNGSLLNSVNKFSPWCYIHKSPPNRIHLKSYSWTIKENGFDESSMCTITRTEKLEPLQRIGQE